MNNTSLAVEIATTGFKAVMFAENMKPHLTVTDYVYSD